MLFCLFILLYLNHILQFEAWNEDPTKEWDKKSNVTVEAKENATTTTTSTATTTTITSSSTTLTKITTTSTKIITTSATTTPKKQKQVEKNQK